jgi:hypothetical protein
MHTTMYLRAVLVAMEIACHRQQEASVLSKYTLADLLLSHTTLCMYSFFYSMEYLSVLLVLLSPVTLERKLSITQKQSSPATRHGGSWGRGSVAPTHS